MCALWVISELVTTKIVSLFLFNSTFLHLSSSLVVVLILGNLKRPFLPFEKISATLQSPLFTPEIRRAGTTYDRIRYQLRVPAPPKMDLITQF